MTLALLLCATVIMICVASSKLSNRFGVPTLLLFIALGMIFGSDGLVKIPFDNYDFAGQICSVALVFIMFYGGFGTNWQMARPVACKAVLLSTLGVVLTALLTGLFCRLVLGFTWLESFLLGSVISSTDAASVFAILRFKKLNLKGGTDSLLELESGSNDPFSYMLTVIMLTLMQSSGAGSVSILGLILPQIFFGVLVGGLVGFVTIQILKRIHFTTAGFDTIFVLAVALLAYSLPDVLGGNGYLSVYIAGIMLGNSKIKNKVTLVHFFDGITGLAQMLIFFLLGLLSTPSQLPVIFGAALAVALFLTFVARPAAVFAILSPFHTPVKEQLLVSWAGLRGAASIVFAIMVISSHVTTQHDIFHIVFCIALLSVAVQGTLLPVIAKKLDLVDDDGNVLKTFNDYQEDDEMHLTKLVMSKDHFWVGKTLSQIPMPANSLVLMIQRGEETIIPRGSTLIQQGDEVILSTESYHDDTNVRLREIPVEEGSPWIGKRIKEIDLPDNTLVIIIKRQNRNIVPKGDSVVKQGDILVLSGLQADVMV